MIGGRHEGISFFFFFFGKKKQGFVLFFGYVSFGYILAEEIIPSFPTLFGC